MFLKIYIVSIFVTLAYFSQIWSSGSATDDVYPLYSWSLFTHPNFKQEQFYIYLRDQKCELPLCQPQEEFWDYEHLVQQLGNAYKNNNQNIYLESKRKLEMVKWTILDGQDYELRFREIDPVDFIKNKKTIKDELIVKIKSFQ